MLANGFLSIAMALDRLGEEPSTVTRYDQIVRTWVRALIDEGVVRGMAMGHPTYDWCYGSNDRPPGCSEDIGHGGYDFWGVYRAYTRRQLGLTMAEVVPFANTFRYLVMQGGGFAARVDGSGTGGRAGSTWLYAAFLRPDIFPAVASALVGAARGGDPDTAGRILWGKDMNSRGWQAEDPPGPPPDGGAPADAAAGDGGDAAIGLDEGSLPAPPDGPAADARAPARDASGSAGRDPAPGSPPGPPAGRRAGCAVGAGSSEGAMTALILVLLVLMAARRRARPVRWSRW